jgi:hypothetical protein
MTEAPGKFSADAVKANEAHQTAVGKEKERHPLPDKIRYEVPREIAKRLRKATRGTSSPPKPLTVASGSTLADPVLASLIYMDVGRWSGGAPTDKDTDAKWGSRRDFGIVHGRLAALCTYPGDSRGSAESEHTYEEVPASTKDSDEFKAILPLLATLSSNPALGLVQVTKAVLGDARLATPPKDDRIYVILGDLHAPVMTQWNRGGIDPPPQQSLADRMGVKSAPGLLKPHVEAEVVRPYSQSYLGWRGRYDPGWWARKVLPLVAPILGETAKTVVGAKSLAAKAGLAGAGALAAGSALANPAGAIANAAAAAGVVYNILDEIRANTVLRAWPDPAQGELTAIEGWFERYHGTSAEKGADIFQDAGTDLERWLDLLKKYRGESLGAKPIQLMQLGDLFDFWIGLKCLFDLAKGAEHTRDFPDVTAARDFLKFWLDESLRNKAISYLWNFDKRAPTAVPPSAPGLETVYLYGNHDTYMGTLLAEQKHGRAKLPGRFDKDPGLVAQHGHQEDFFNTERTAGLGYLLTQAVFSDNYIRTIEDPMGSIGPKFCGGTWTRLGLTEMALKACVFANVSKGQKPAMTFVMGHTHEPVLQTINVVKRERPKEPADWHTSVETEP